MSLFCTCLLNLRCRSAVLGFSLVQPRSVVCGVFFYLGLRLRVLSEGGLSKEHNIEGRVIVLKYPSVTVVALYVPNNGVKEESFERRYRL